jgi:5-methylcytosine-specific restriction protein A
VAYKPQSRTTFTKTKDHRPSARQRGYTTEWEKARKHFLAEHPFCGECDRQGRPITPANIVDHVRPHRGNQERFWNIDLWESLCKRCHDHKTPMEENLDTYTRTVVTGLPRSGKTTYVERHRKPGDLVWDWDYIAKEMLRLPLHETPADCIDHLNAMAEVFCREIASRPPKRNVWIILTNEDRARRVAEMVSGELVTCNYSGATQRCVSQ